MLSNKLRFIMELNLLTEDILIITMSLIIKCDGYTDIEMYL